MFNYFWGVVVILLPLILRVVNKPYLAVISKDIFFVFCCLVSFSIFKVGEVKNRSILYLSLLSPLVYFNQGNTFDLAFLYQGICYLCGFILLKQAMTNKQRLDKFFAWACYIQVYFISVSVLYGGNAYNDMLRDLFGFDIVVIVSDADLYNGTINNPTVLAWFLAITIPFVQGRIMKSLPILLLILSNSATGVIALISGWLFVKWRNAKFIYWRVVVTLAPITFMILAYISTFPGYLNGHGRITMWLASLEKMNNYVIGDGMAFFYEQKIMIKNKLMLQAHSEFLELFIVFGLLGVALLLYFFWYNRDKILRAEDSYLWSFVSILVCALTGFNFHMSTTAVVGILVIGKILSEVKDEPRMELQGHIR